jgi:hypothetical protein
MISALLSFLGGSAFRMLWGEISAFVNKRQDHSFEIERMKLQADLDAAQHERNLKAITVQAELGVKTIEVQAEGDVARIEAQGWLEAVKGTTNTTGVWIIDVWNSSIRPLGASWALAMLTCHEFGWLAAPLSENTQMVAYAFLGLFVADRALGKQGK